MISVLFENLDFTPTKKSAIMILTNIRKAGEKVVNEEMGMSDKQFEVYNALLTFIDELIDREKDESEKEKLKIRKKNILANNKEIG